MGSSPNKLSEKEYYKPVETFIKKEFTCMKTGICKGSLSLGLADVIGVYDVSSEFHNQVETVIVEVKKQTSNFGKSLGQALGYSIFGERCYLAVTFHGNDTFSDEQIYMADHLGVGLIRIPIRDNGKPKTSDIRCVITSTQHQPIKAQYVFSYRVI